MSRARPTSCAPALAAILAALFVSSISPAAANPELEAAKNAYAELEFEVASQHLERAYQWGKNTPAEMREILRFSGEMAAALGDGAGAEEFFFQMLTLAPSADLPEGSSPKLTYPFDQAKKRVEASGGLEARCEIDHATPALRVSIVRDPANLVAGARAIYTIPGGSEQRAEARGEGDILIALPNTPGLSLFCTLIDHHGNHLLEIGSRDAPRVLEPTTVIPDKTPRDTGEPRDQRRGQAFYAHWITWGSLGVASAAAGGVFAWRMRSDQKALDALNVESDEHDYAEADALARSGRDNALYANIGFAVAGAFAVVSIVQFIRRPGDERAAGSASIITPVFSPDGAGIAVHARF